MSDARLSSEAFALTSDPSAYVPSPERERALDDMASALAEGSVPCLEGPTGIGKTLLLQILAQRVADRFDPLYVPYPMLSTPELCTLAIGLLGHSLTPDPQATLLRSATERAARGRPLLLLIDDATSLPADTARGLAAMRAQARGALQIALAGIDGHALREATAPFGEPLVRVALEERMPRAEVRDYVAAQLEHVSAPASLRRAFDDAVLEELERAASGNPRRLHLAAQSIMRRAETSPEASAEATSAAQPPPQAQPIAPRAPDPVEAPAPAPAPPRVAPRAPGEPIGQYRVVRKRPPEGEAEPAPPPAAPQRPARGTPPPRPAAPAREARPAPLKPPPPPAPKPAAPPPPIDVAAAIASVSESPPLPKPPWEAPAAPAPPDAARSRAQDAAPPAAERPPRRIAMAPIFLAVAVVSAALGFLLASGLQRDALPAPRPAEPPTAERAPASPPTSPAPRAGEQVAEAPQPSPAPTPAPTPDPARAAAVAPAPSRAPAAVPAPPPPPAPIEISINAAPWALIEIDGRAVGETPLGGIEVERGPHRFVARFPDGRVVERTIEIDATRRTLVFE